MYLLKYGTYVLIQRSSRDIPLARDRLQAVPIQPSLPTQRLSPGLSRLPSSKLVGLLYISLLLLLQSLSLLQQNATDVIILVIRNWRLRLWLRCCGKNKKMRPLCIETKCGTHPVWLKNSSLARNMSRTVHSCGL